MTHNPAGNRLKQVIESEGFLELVHQLDAILGDPVWWCCPNLESPLTLIRSHNKRDCGLLNDDPKIRKEWHEATSDAMKEVFADRVGLMTISPPGHVQVVVPVLCGNDLHGIVGVSHLPEYEQRRLPPLLSLLIEHLRQIAERVRSDQDMRGIRRLWNDFVSTLDLGALLERILEEILILLDSPDGVLFLTDPDKRLIPRKSIGTEEVHLEDIGYPLSAAPYENKMKSWDQPARPLSEGDPLRDWYIQHTQSDTTQQDVWGVPLMHFDHLYGLVVCRRKKGAIIEKHLGMSLDTLTLGSSVAIRNAHEFENMRQKSIALSTVHSVYRLMSSTRVASDLLHRMANLTLQVLNSRKCSIMLADPEGNLQPCVTLGLGEGEIGTQPLELGESIPGLVAEEGISLRVQNPVEDPRFETDPKNYYQSESYLSVPLFEEDVVGVITVGEKAGSPSSYSVGDREVLNTMAEQAVIALMNIQYFEKQERIALKTMGTFENLFETGDPDTEGRSQKLATLISGLAESIQIDEKSRQNFQMAAFLQSLGYLGDEKAKDGEGIADSERDSKRVAMAIRMAKRMDLSDTVVPILRDHLENFDGSGNPRGLKGDEIPLGARLLSLSEAYLEQVDPLNGEEGIGIEEALQVIEKASGSRFDPNLVEAIKEFVRKDSSD